MKIAIKIVMAYLVIVLTIVVTLVAINLSTDVIGGAIDKLQVYRFDRKKRESDFKNKFIPVEYIAAFTEKHNLSYDDKQEFARLASILKRTWSEEKSTWNI